MSASKVKNFYTKIPKHLLNKVDNPNYPNHLINIPCRIICQGPTGSGKTNFVINLIEKFSSPKGTYVSIYIITKNKDELLYKYLEYKSDQIVIKEGLHSLPELDKFDKEQNHLVIIDDLVLEKNQQSIIDYFIRCRKLNVSVVYISQSFYSIPKVIRQNANYFVILKMGSLKNLKLILSEFQLNIDKNTLLKIYDYCTNEKFNFLLIDMDNDEKNRFRKNFTEIIDVNDFKD